MNITITVTKPDGTTQTLGPYNTDDVGSLPTYYTPTTTGTYYFQMSFPGQTVVGTDAFTGLPVNNYYEPCTSANVPLTVQTAPILPYPTYPLPTGYWTNPISSELGGSWAPISGNWLGIQGSYDISGKFNPYTTAPNTAHVVWTKDVTYGGLVGGDFGSVDYYTGMSYENKWSPPIIISGKLYYNTPATPCYGFYCVDLRTGQTIWYQNGSATTATTSEPVTGGSNAYSHLSMGQLYNYGSPNQDGVIPYLWGTSGSTWSMYDAQTGNWILDLDNATGAIGLGLFQSPLVYDSQGDMLLYMVGDTWVAMWNSSAVQGMLAGTSGPSAWEWRPPMGSILNWQTGIQWNVTVAGYPGQSIQQVGPAYPGQSIENVADDVIIASSPGTTTIPATYVHIGYNATTGQEIWRQTRTGYKGLGPLWDGIGPMDDGVYTVFDMAALSWYGYNASTGQQMWGPTTPYTSAWGFYMWGVGSPSTIAYGCLYSADYDGTVHCYNVTTGQHLWDSAPLVSGLETPYGVYPFYGGITVADGKLYIATGEHSPMAVLYQGEKLCCFDATNGNLLWSFPGWFNPSGLGAGTCPGPAVADGYLVSLNVGDGQIYCFGKGQTATTVSASPVTLASGEPTTIQGTVTDQSPGAAGTPAVSDASMTQWMEYLYQQLPKPTNATGVKVTLTALDPNNNTENLGTVTTDITGHYGLMWTPPVPGYYTITATFAGTNSYFSSSAETGIGVDSAASASAVSALAPSTSSAPTVTYVAIAAAVIIIVALVAALMLRRRRK
jgi:hypothetical protein